MLPYYPVEAWPVVLVTFHFPCHSYSHEPMHNERVLPIQLLWDVEGLCRYCDWYDDCLLMILGWAIFLFGEDRICADDYYFDRVVVVDACWHELYYYCCDVVFSS
jgi:hypothetical protein